jgi:hypothetical protein
MATQAGLNGSRQLTFVRSAKVTVHCRWVGLIVANPPLENTGCGTHIPVMALSLVRSWRSIARAIVSAVMLVLFAYGASRFSDGPIGTCGSGYCSTRHPHLPHTAADYRAYKAWEMTILIVWPLGLTALFLLQREKPKGSE